MLPSKGSLLALLFLACFISVNCLPFNAKYRFVRDAETTEDDGSGKSDNSTINNIAEGTNDNTTTSEDNKDDTKENNGESTSEFAGKDDETTSENKQTEENPPQEDDTKKAEKDPNDDEQNNGEFSDPTGDPKEGSSNSKSDIEEAEEDNTDEGPEDAEMNEEDKSNDLKMFFISPFEKSDDEDPSARQILTYPAKSKGWGYTHQFGPSHIWNSDYPYFAYGYSWGCGHHGYGPYGHVKKSKVKGKKDDTLCRDYILIPAVAPAPAVLAPNDFENGVTRNFVSKDIACNEGDTECAQRQVIGSMAGGSMFGDGMGGLGMGFPGVPGIHTGISGYNMAGGFGDRGHRAGCHGPNGCGAGYGGYGPAHFVKSDEHGIPSFWNAREDIPRGEEITKNFIAPDGDFGPGAGATFFKGEDILPIHEASAGVGSGHSYTVGSAQWWDKTPSFRGGYGLGHGDVPFNAGIGFHGAVGTHGDAFLGGPLRDGCGGSYCHGGYDGDVHGYGALGHGYGGLGYGGYGGYNGGYGAYGGYGYGGHGYGLAGHGVGYGLAGHGDGYGLVGHGDGYGLAGHGVGYGYGHGLGHGYGYGLADHVAVGAGHHGYNGGWALGGHATLDGLNDDGMAGHFGLDTDHGITFTNGIHHGGHHVLGSGPVGHAVVGHGLHGFVKSNIKHSKKSKTAKATTRQDIAMPDEQAMMDVTKQRQLIGSLGASTLFSDNVGGMGLGHPGVPQMSSGVSGIPGEYGGSGGFSHGWDGEGPGDHPHGYNNFGYNGGDHDYRSETPQPTMVDENPEKRQVIGGIEQVDPTYAQSAATFANGDHGAMALGGFPGHGTTQYTSVHHHRISHDDGDDDGYVNAPVAGGYLGNGYVGNGYVGNAVVSNGVVGNGYVAGVPAGRYGVYGRGPLVAGHYRPRHVHVGVGTPGVKVEVETAKSVIQTKPVHVTAQKMSEIKNIVKDVSASLAKTNKKLKHLKAGGDKRQITPAFTPVVSEPAAVPSIRYPVPAADRYPLGAGYIWPSANYGHQYGGPYSWSKSHTPKAAKPSKAKSSKRHKTKRSGEKHKRSIEKHHQKKKDDGRKRQFIHHGYGDMPNYGMGESMPYPRSFGFGPGAGGVLNYGGHHYDGGFGDGFHGDYHYGAGHYGGLGHIGYSHHGGYPVGVLSGHGDFGGYGGLGHGYYGHGDYGHDGFAGHDGFGHDGFGAFDAGHHEYGVEGGIDLHGGYGGHYGGHFGLGHGLGYGHGGYYGGSHGIVGDYDGDHGALELDTHGYGGHHIDSPLGPLGGHALRFSHGGGLEQGLMTGYGHGALGHGVYDGGYGAHGGYDLGPHGIGHGYAGGLGGFGLGHGVGGFGLGHGMGGIGLSHGDNYAAFGREHIEQDESQFMSPNSRSVTPEPMYNEQESSSLFSSQQPYEMEREYAGAKKSKVPK